MQMKVETLKHLREVAFFEETPFSLMSTPIVTPPSRRCKTLARTPRTIS